MTERVVDEVDGVYCWRGPRPKRSTLKAHAGRLVLTTERLLFLANDGEEQIGYEAIDHPDSLDFSFNGLRSCVATEKHRRSWLSVRGVDAEGRSGWFTFGHRTFQDAQLWHDRIVSACGGPAVPPEPARKDGPGPARKVTP